MEEYSLCFAFWVLLQRCLLTLIRNPKSKILNYALCPLLSAYWILNSDSFFFNADSKILPILLAPFLLK